MPTITETLALTDRAALADIFYDWFCDEELLPSKAEILQRRLCEIAGSWRVAPTWEVLFKNNSPVGGRLYDDFRLCEPGRGGAVIYTVVPHDGVTGLAEVWGRENSFDGPLVEGSWGDVVAWFCGARGG